MFSYFKGPVVLVAKVTPPDTPPIFESMLAAPGDVDRLLSLNKDFRWDEANLSTHSPLSCRLDFKF